MTNDQHAAPHGSTDSDEHRGYCPCCRSDTVFRRTGSWLRDEYLCTRCSSIPRQRHLQHVLDTRFAGWEGLTIHEAAPSSDFVAGYSTDYNASQYFPGVPSGVTVDGTVCQDLENLSLPDNSVDLFITQDVLEHVMDPARAVQEVHRTIRPGGAHLFTTPKHQGLLETRRRAAVRSDGTIEHLLPAEYHGSPVGDHRILVSFDFGCDFEQHLSAWSGVSVETVQTLDLGYGLQAEFNEVFVIRKPPLAPVRRISPAELDLVETALASHRRTVANLAEREDKALAALEELKASTSWRVTAPLRAATDRARQLRRRFR